MKFNLDKKYFYWGATAFSVVVASVLFYYLIFHMPTIISGISNIFSILGPILYGAVIAYLLNPLVCWLERLVYKVCKRNNWNVSKRIRSTIRFAVVLLSLFLALLCIYGLLYMLIPEIFGSITNIIDNFPRYVDNVQQWLVKFFQSDDEMNAITMETFNRYSLMLENWLTNDFMPQLNGIIKNLSSGVFGFITFLKNFVIGAIISIYLLNSKETFIARGKRILYTFLSVPTANKIIHNLRFVDDKFGGFIIGKVIDSAIIGVLCYICTNMMSTPYSLLISVVVGITNVIPFFGPFFGAIPSALLIFVVSPIKCLYFIIFIIILQQIDGNIIGPKILSGSTGLSSFMVIVAILIGGGFFGVLGMFVGVPVCSVIVAICQAWMEDKMKQKNLPEDLEHYKDLESIDPEDMTVVPLKERKSGESRLYLKDKKDSVKKEDTKEILENKEE